MRPGRLAGEAGLASALLDTAAPCPPGLRAWNGSDPAVRLAVHRNNVLSSLVDVLADSFPVTSAVVGAEFFRAMAALFVRQAPPRSPVLAHYGGGLPAFIAGFGPAQALPYLADLARLEWARQRAVHAADAPALADDAVAAALASGHPLAALRLVCHPSLSVLASPYAVVSLWAAHQQADEAGRDAALAALDVAQPESALVLRTGWDVGVLPLPPGAACFVAALRDGAGLADAVQAALHEVPDFDLAGVLALLRRRGALTAIHSPQED